MAPTFISSKILLSGARCLINEPRWPAAQYKANSYYCPRGFENGRAWVLLTRADFDNIKSLQSHTLTFETKQDGSGAGDFQRNVSFGPLYLVGNTKLDVTAADDPNAVHLIELADVRFLGTQLSRFFSISENSTWQTILNQNWDLLPSVFGAVPLLPFTPLGKPKEFECWWRGKTAWEVIHMILRKWHMTTAINPLVDAGSDKFRIVRIGAAQDLGTLPEPPYHTFEPLEANQTRVAEKVQVVFPDTSAVLRNTNASGATAGSVKTIWDDLRGQRSSEQSARVQELVDCYVQAARTPRAHKLYPSILTNVKPGERIAEVLYRHFGSGDGTITEFKSGPGPEEPWDVDRLIDLYYLTETLYPGDSANSKRYTWDTTDKKLVVGDIAERVYDQQLRTPADVKYGQNFGLPGEAMRATCYTPSGYHETQGEQGLRRWGLVEVDEYENTPDGSVTQISVNILTSTEPSCLGTKSGVIVSACYTSRATKLKAGDRVLVHYHPELKKWFVITAVNAGADIVRFELYEDKPFKTAARAWRVHRDLSRYGALITVVDSIGWWHGLALNAGMYGWAIHMPDNPNPTEYEILFMEAPARFLEFTLTQKGSDGASFVGGVSQGATVFRGGEAFWGLTPNGIAGGENSVDIWDELGLFPRAQPGSNGIAVLDERVIDVRQPRRGRYRAIICDQMSPEVKATLYTKLCDSDQTGNVNKDSLQPCFFAPLGQIPNNIENDTTIDNPYGLAGKAGDPCLLGWNHTRKKWFFKQLLHVGFDVLLAPDGSASTGCKTIRKLHTPLMRCEDPTDAQLFEEKSVVTAFRTSDEGCAAASGSGSATIPGDCLVEAKREKVCVLKRTPAVDEPAEEWIDVMPLTPVEMVVDVWEDGYCIKQQTEWVWVVCHCSARIDTVFCTDPCSGSGS